MLRSLVFPAAVVLILGFLPVAGAQDNARAVVERAIAAHGGAARIDKYQAVHARAKSTIYLGNLEIPVKMETFIQLPDRFKIVMEMDVQGQKLNMTQILTGDKGSVTINGKTDPATDVMLTQLKETQFAERAVRLTPLLRDPAFELTGLGESKFEDKPVQGVQVRRKGFNDIRMYFDKASGLLVRLEKKAMDSNMKEVMQEDIYSDFRDVQGVKRPMKVRMNHDGKKFLEGEMVEIQPLDRLEDVVFAKP